MAIFSVQESKEPVQRIFQTIGLALLFAVPSLCATTVGFQLALAQPAARTLVADISSRLLVDYSAEPPGFQASLPGIGNVDTFVSEVSKEEEQKEIQEQQPTPTVLIIDFQPTPTSTPVPEASPTPQPTNTPSGQQQRNPTPTPQPTNTPRPTNTPQATNTPTPTNTPTATPTPTPTDTPTPTPTDTPTPTPTPIVPQIDVIDVTEAIYKNNRLVVKGTGTINGCTVTLLETVSKKKVQGGNFSFNDPWPGPLPPLIATVSSECGGLDSMPVTIQ